MMISSCSVMCSLMARSQGRNKDDWIIRKMTTPTGLLCHGFPSKFSIFLNYSVLSDLMINQTTHTYMECSVTCSFVKVTSITTSLIGVYNNALCNPRNLVQVVESHSVCTFSPKEMAFNILGLMRAYLGMGHEPPDLADITTKSPQRLMPRAPFARLSRDNVLDYNPTEAVLKSGQTLLGAVLGLTWRWKPKVSSRFKDVLRMALIMSNYELHFDRRLNLVKWWTIRPSKLSTKPIFGHLLDW